MQDVHEELTPREEGYVGCMFSIVGCTLMIWILLIMVNAYYINRSRELEIKVRQLEDTVWVQRLQISELEYEENLNIQEAVDSLI